jgi:hypothetical protein
MARSCKNPKHSVWRMIWEFDSRGKTEKHYQETEKTCHTKQRQGAKRLSTLRSILQ